MGVGVGFQPYFFFNDILSTFNNNITRLYGRQIYGYDKEKNHGPTDGD